ncbi:Type II secretion system F domain [Syntrophomonas zehnderi OL-4]|uniref:Type II secretion system F domain n=1 Tax=Syntrophomonas zehnderi OL-4 TaxID=690567 RepID=A0A0E4GCI5_9FIRM|nr:type II secretion system F family protein [Syntrophomonas zehnderi]CFX15334.1 Type II secretion system F domain [Syntrophomonas zehnderi OL-4]
MAEFVIAGAATSIGILSWLLYRWQNDFNSQLLKKQTLYGLIAAGLFFLLLLVFKNPVAGVLAVVLMGLCLKRRRELAKKARNRIIENQAEVALQLIASFYDNTGDIMTALKEAADCIQPPLADELRLTVTQYNANKAPLLALQDMAERIDDRDISIFVNAVILSERYGTDTAQVIKDVSRKISHRISLRDELKNEVWGQGMTIRIFFIVLPVLTAALMLIPDIRQVLINGMGGKIIINVLLLVEYCAWYFSTNQEVIDQL